MSDAAVRADELEPGPIVLFGSGETSATGRAVHDWVFRRLRPRVRVAILETPAGFELNSDQVAGRIADFLRQRLQNYRPEIAVVPARRRGTSHSPDEPTIVAPLLTANDIFVGPGSPSYAIRQLAGSLAWQYLTARHRLGAAITLASAATIAAGAHALPIYEIYKVGEDPFWRAGLDLLGPFGLPLVFVPHWNNSEGGAGLDTSHCFIGRSRFEDLQSLLPDGATIVGIDEQTALVIDLAAGQCQVMGNGGVVIRRSGVETLVAAGVAFPVAELGPARPPPTGDVPDAVWLAARAAAVAEDSSAADDSDSSPSPEVLALTAERDAARGRRDWPAADALRARIADLGWQIADRPEGPDLSPTSRDESS